MVGNTNWQEEGRINQKRRTRAAVLEAAKRILREGHLPSVAEAADVALVSRATAYRYFPRQEYLLSEAALESARTDVDQLLERAAPSDDPALRLDTLVQALQQVTLEQEAAFRTLLHLSLEPRPAQGQMPEAKQEQLRGGRRVGWIEEALAPVGSLFENDPQTLRRLVAALSLCMGIEALVVLQDVCGLGAAETADVSRWAAQALLQAGLRGSRAPSPLEASSSHQESG